MEKHELRAATSLAAVFSVRMPGLFMVYPVFAGFNIMEASLPSLVTKTVPTGARGTATGIYSSSQFLGIFAGGAVGGWGHEAAGTTAVFLFAAAVASVGLLVAASMRSPALGHDNGRLPLLARRSADR